MFRFAWAYQGSGAGTIPVEVPFQELTAAVPSDDIETSIPSDLVAVESVIQDEIAVSVSGPITVSIDEDKVTPDLLADV